MYWVPLLLTQAPFVPKCWKKKIVVVVQAWSTVPHLKLRLIELYQEKSFSIASSQGQNKINELGQTLYWNVCVFLHERESLNNTKFPFHHHHLNRNSLRRHTNKNLFFHYPQHKRSLIEPWKWKLSQLSIHFALSFLRFVYSFDLIKALEELEYYSARTKCENKRITKKIAENPLASTFQQALHAIFSRSRLVFLL